MLYKVRMDYVGTYIIQQLIEFLGVLSVVLHFFDAHFCCFA